ncbi:Zn-ribbon domain-containing OB-fold protein [candidate division KSB1 bacterium]|nr:Zn-ribbon domain-containing OB-fold protein [candidate division KSB1 bacterium]NIR69874.1 Zn-ribbon domain-containing OB-fold protein [candidate division KSB1 bacterium]NIS22993.1 Zn-ribbon domain-containing OB-fold protein [candidate division KSB1 bacterium]NIT69851.1 Zn-ribbon domain-containing OB-fold protein [candidate division KSB1 bacterium]NIU25773.1 Zn-ribbon domain-containing OB-fold protein [candidate division KSB1 bacterium]
MKSPRYTREIPQRYRLEAARCESCGKIHFPPRLICPDCQSGSFRVIKLRDKGKVLTYTVIHVAPEQFATQTPYIMAIVELNDGVKITSQIVDCGIEDVRIGEKVKVVFRKIQQDGRAGILCYGYKCVLSR